MTARLLRYAPFELRDFLLQRLSLPLVLMAFVAALPTYFMTRNVPAGFMATPQGISMARQMFSGSIALFLPLGAFVGAVSVISGDRQQGYFRFLFSKPINLVAYYAQALVLNAAAFVAAFGVIVWAFGAYTIHFSVHRSMEAALLTFVLIGGLGLLFGAVTRFDAAAVIVVYLVALILQQMLASPTGLRNGGLPEWMVWVAKGLPPVGKLDTIRNHLYAGEAIDLAQLWHVLGYGGAAALVGFVLLRRLPLAR